MFRFGNNPEPTPTGIGNKCFHNQRPLEENLNTWENTRWLKDSSR
jgi:hypothetical protein